MMVDYSDFQNEEHMAQGYTRWGTGVEEKP